MLGVRAPIPSSQTSDEIRNGLLAVGLVRLLGARGLAAGLQATAADPTNLLKSESVPLAIGEHAASSSAARVRPTPSAGDGTGGHQ